MHGLFENAIYGGRVDNYFDMRVLRSYLEQLFNSRVIGGLNTRGKKMTNFPYSVSLPNSCSILVGVHLLSPNTETKPSYFQELLLVEIISQIQIGYNLKNASIDLGLVCVKHYSLSCQNCFASLSV